MQILDVYMMLMLLQDGSEEFGKNRASNVPRARYSFDRKEDVMTAVNITALPEQGRQFHSLFRAAKELVETFTKLEVPMAGLQPNRFYPYFRTMNNLNFWYDKETKILTLHGTAESVGVASEHIEQFIKGEHPVSRTIDCASLPDGDRLGDLICRYVKLTSIAPRLQDIQQRLEDKYTVAGRRRISSTVSNDADSSVILTVQGPQDDIEGAVAFATAELALLAQGLTLSELSNLHMWQVEWLSKNYDVSSQDNVVIDIHTPDDVDTALKCRCSIGDIEVLVVWCDFTDTGATYRCDTLVNSANSQLSHCGGIAKAIADAAGFDLKAECCQIGDVAVTEAVCTDSYLLKKQGFRRIVHAVAPIMTSSECDVDIHQRLASTIGNVLTLSESEHSIAVAIPGLGMGLFGWSVDDAARSIVIGLSEWIGTKKVTSHDDDSGDQSTSIQNIVLFDSSSEKVEGFIRGLKDLQSGELLRSDVFSFKKRQTLIPPHRRPEEPQFQWLWTVWSHENSAKHAKALIMHEGMAMIPYDYDQNFLLESAFSRGDSDVLLLGDLNGIANDKKYGVNFNAMTQTTIPQFNSLSCRPIVRVPVANPTSVPLYLQRVAEYEASMRSAELKAAEPDPVLSRELPVNIENGPFVDAQKSYKWQVTVFGEY
jgi:O-acetyl-ADP-ribose deacetylase